MLFSELLGDAGLLVPIIGTDVEVVDIQRDARRCGKNSCFVAVPGRLTDGHQYINDAIAAGASAVVCERQTAMGQSLGVALVEDTHEVLGLLCQACRCWPVRKLRCIGITGTNGKTTVAHLTKAILEAAGLRPALISTVVPSSGKSAGGPATTPDAVALAEMTEEMVSTGRTHLVMEVSSHALDQRRTAGVDFEVAAFTNLSGDHLDYHGDMKTYLAAKLLLFGGLQRESTAVINRDDAHWQEVAESTKARVVLYSLKSSAELRGEISQMDPSGSQFTLIAGRERVEVRTPLIGVHNVQNCLAAASSALAMGTHLSLIADALRRIQTVPGRLERVPASAPYSVYVDYAHTDDALRNVLLALRPVTRGRIVLAFGCGGDRDVTKRPRMAAVAEDLADRIVVTSDNPRSERPSDIVDDILAGLSIAGRAKCDVECDRAAAIEIAVGQARPGDVVLIAGKGHEKCQIIGDQRIDFDDVCVAAEAMRKFGAES